MRLFESKFGKSQSNSVWIGSDNEILTSFNGVNKK